MNLNSTSISRTVSDMFGDVKTKLIIIIAYRLMLNFQVSNMVWGCIRSKGFGRLKLLTKTVNASVYTQVLEESLKPIIQDSFKGAENCIFNRAVLKRWVQNTHHNF